MNKHDDKSELIIEMRKFCLELLEEIRDYIQFDEATPTNNTPPEIFSLFMDQGPPEEIMPCLRAC